MMHHLEKPLPLPGLQIDAAQAVPKQVVPQPMPAVLIRRRVFHGKIDQAKVLIGGDMRPYAGVAVGGPRIVLPRVVANLSRLWNRVELPKFLAGPYVEGLNETFGVVVGDDLGALLEGRGDDHDVLDDGRRRMETNLTGLQVDLLVDS